MKAFLSIVMLYALAVPPGFSQNRECIISDRYETDVYDVKPLSGGRWAVAAQHLTYPGALEEEFFSVAIIDSLGRLEKLLPVTFQYENETSSVGPLWVMPNDEIIIRYQTGNCDAGYHAFEIEKIDTLGNIIWHQFMPWQSIITNLWIAPDGNYMVSLTNNKVGKISSETGEMIWTYEHSFGYEYDYQFVPGTEDFIVGETYSLRYFEHHEDVNGVSYIETKKKDMQLDSGRVYLRGIDEEGSLYGVVSRSHKLFRFDVDLNIEFLAMLPGDQVYVSKDHVLLREGYPDISIKIFDLDGNYISEKVFSWENGLSLKDFYLTSRGLAIIGRYLSGPDTITHPGFIFYGRSQGWFRYFPNYEFTDSPRKFSLAVTDIEQLEAVEVDSFYSLGPDYEGYLYNLSGGKFKIQVTNSGTDTVQSFYLNIIFNEITNYWFCPPYSAVSNYYDHQEIGPGESAFFEFEGLTAYRQKDNSTKFCFWPSEINHRPDDIPEDDRYCFDRLVKTNFPLSENISLYPNPADDEIHILNLPYNNSNTSWTLFDAMGRINKEGKVNVGEDKLEIKVKDLSPGIYIIQVGKMNGRFIVQQ